MEAALRSRWERVAPFLACPHCRGGLHLLADAEEGEARCRECGKVYPLRDGVLDFGPPEDRGEWRLGGFEETYRSTGDFLDDWQWREKQGIPREVTDYDFPLIKGRLIEWLDPFDGCVHLDVGCGVGHFFDQIAGRYPGVSMISVGIEITHERLRWLSARVRKGGRESVFPLLGTAERLPLADGGVDRVTCTEVLEHVADPAAAIREMVRVVRPGGLVLVSTPSRGAIERWDRLFAPAVAAKRLLFGRSADERPEAYDRPLHAPVLRAHLEDAGLRVLDFIPSVAIPHRHYLARLPRGVMRAVLACCGFAERRLPGFARAFGQHVVVRCRKDG